MSKSLKRRSVKVKKSKRVKRSGKPRNKRVKRKTKSNQIKNKKRQLSKKLQKTNIKNIITIPKKKQTGGAKLELKVFKAYDKLDENTYAFDKFDLNTDTPISHTLLINSKFRFNLTVKRGNKEYKGIFFEKTDNEYIYNIVKEGFYSGKKIIGTINEISSMIILTDYPAGKFIILMVKDWNTGFIIARQHGFTYKWSLYDVSGDENIENNLTQSKPNAPIE